MRSASGWLKKTRGSVRVWLSCALAALVLVPALLWADAPAWWTERGVLKPGATVDDYAAVNQGQVKHIAKQGYEEMKAKLPGGAGSTLDTIWATPAASTDDYRAINLGQLKNVAEPFYARLAELGYTGQPLASGQTRPWSGTADDYALANIGQVKNLFSFDLSSISLDDNVLILVAGDRQSGPAGQVLPQALTVRVINELGLPVSGVTVTFTVTSGTGTLGATASGGTATTLTSTSGLTGQAAVYGTVNGSAGALNAVTTSLTSQSLIFSEYVSTLLTSLGGDAGIPAPPAGDTASPGGAPSGLPDYALDDQFEMLDDIVDGFKVDGFIDNNGNPASNGTPDYSTAVLSWTNEVGNVTLHAERRIDFGTWMDLGAASSGYKDEGLQAGVLYEYRLKAMRGGKIVGYGPTFSYDVPILKSILYGGHELFMPRYDSTATGSYGPHSYPSDSVVQVSEGIDLAAFAFEDTQGWEAFSFYDYFYSAGTPPGEYTPQFYDRSTGVEPKWRQLLYQASHTNGNADAPQEEKKTGEGPVQIGFPSGRSWDQCVAISAAGDFMIKFRGGYISPDSIPASGLELAGDESFEIIPINRGTYISGMSWWPGFWGWWGGGWEFIGPEADAKTINVTGNLIKTGNEDLGRIYYDWYDYFPAPTTTITMPASALPGYSASVTIGDVTFDVSVPGESSAGANIPSSESSGAKYRKIALNGAPLSDEKPQQAAESDQPPEETFIDALTLGLRHDTTDVYTSVPASDLSLSVRRSATSDIWNLKSGLRPEERPDRPFGANWTTNLAANIHFTHMLGDANEDGSNPDTATVTDENGAEYTFAILYSSNATYAPTSGYSMAGAQFIPLPSSNHEQSIYLCSLTAIGTNTFIFKRKFGSTLIYTMTELTTSFPSDRIKGSTSGTKHTYARLNTVTDRYGNQLDYSYGSVYTVIPATITVHKSDGSTGAVLSIRQDSSGHITDIWDPKGHKTHYAYTETGTSMTSCTTLNNVTAADGKQTYYNWQITPEIDQNPSTTANVGNYYHVDLTGITDPLNHSYGFSYLPDHTKYDYSSDAGYYVKSGLPFQVHQTTLPNGEHATFTNNSQNLKVAHDTTTHVETMVAGYVRRNTVVDALGNQRDYDFTNVRVEVLPSFETVYKHAVKLDNPRMVYYRTMTITPYAGKGTSKIGLGGSEAFTFDPNSGMSVTSATDFSGNTTTYTYTDTFAGQSVFTGAGMTGSTFGFYSDPTSQTNALQKTKHFTYGANRVMTSSKDEAGVKTEWEIDSLGRRKSEKIFPADSTTVIQETVFSYGNTTFPNFMTKKTVKKLGTADPSWVADLVTLYVPNANGRVEQEVVDMNGNGTIEPSVDLVTAYTYDLNGNKLTSKDPRGNVTTFSYDQRNRLTHVTYADAHQKQLFYDDRGNKTKETDENGVATFWVYDSLNRVSHQVTDLNDNGAIDYLADGVTPDRTKDIVVSNTYNALNAKLTTTDPKGTVTKFEYDALQRLTQKTDDFGGLNYVTIYEYDVTKNTGGSAFDSSGFKPTKVTDPRGYRTEVTYDKLYRPTEEKAEYQTNVYAVTTKNYDDVGNLLTVTDPLGTITKTTYDGLRRPLTITEAFGTSLAATTTKAYTSTGFAWKITDALNRETRTDYDAAGRPVNVFAPAVVDALSTSTTPVSPVTETRYDAAGNVSYVINPLGRRTDYSYDNRNRRYEEKLPTVTDATTGLASRPVRTTAYDGVGNVIAVQDARGFITTTEYDNARRPKKVIAPPMTKVDGTTVNPTTETSYDKAGNVLTVTDANNHVTTNTYDALNRLKTTTQKPDTNPAHDIVVTNEYDAAGNRTAVIDGKSQRTEFTYDGLNRNLTVKDPANRSVTFTYDAVNKTARVDSENHRTEYGYDARHRLTGVNYVGRTQDNRSYAYDAVGQLLSVTESGKGGKADVAYTYDALGRQLTETSGGKQHTYGYDLANNRVKVTYGGTGTVLVSTYDALNRLQTLSETPPLSSQLSTLSYPRTTTYGYDLNGNRVLQQLPNGEEVDTQYDALNRAVAITTSKSSGALLLQLSQTYDPAGNLVKLTERHYGSTLAPRTVTNAYDNVNRLTSEVNVEGSAKTIATTYGFDRANNRTAKAVATTTGAGTTLVETAYVYNNLNQLQTATTGTAVTTYGYDLNGNRSTSTLVSAPNAPPLTDTYSYDYENRLVGLTKNTSGGTGTYAYVYDYRTRRVERTESGTTTKSVFSGGLSVAEYDGAATTSSPPSAEYIRGSDWGGGVGGLLYSVRSGVPSFKHYNSRGDVISATDDAGAATWQGTYEAFGKRTQESGSTQDRQKANTKEEDPTGLLNEGFRYRDLETGAFITRDPLGFVDGPNMYAYVVQNPWSKFDPEGLLETVITNQQATSLPDSADVINNYVNKVIADAYTTPKAQLGSGGIRKLVYTMLTNRQSFGGNKTNIVKDLGRNNPELLLKQGVEGTKYDGALRIYGARVPNIAANEAIAYGMNIGGQAIGSDKLDHMFGDAYAHVNKPEKTARSDSLSDEHGNSGAIPSGVISHADVEANMAGYKFYNDMEAAYAAGKPYTFDIRTMPLRAMNENENKNDYTKSVGAKVKENEAKAEKKEEDKK